MWRLHLAEYRLIAFVHDEIVIEFTPEQLQDALGHAEKVEKIMVDAMSEVCGGTIVR